MNEAQKALAEHYAKTIRSKGLFAEITDFGVSVSFTGFDLEQVFATISIDEIQYHVDNDEYTRED